MTLTDVHTSLGQHYVALLLVYDCPMLIYVFDRIDERNPSAFPIDGQQSRIVAKRTITEARISHARHKTQD